jgi:hypothetical protein
VKDSYFYFNTTSQEFTMEKSLEIKHDNSGIAASDKL